MLDVVGTVLLVALAALLVAVVAPVGDRPGVNRTGLGIGIAAWFVVAALLGAAGAFASPALPVGVAVGLAVLAPVIIGFGVITRTHGLGVPMTTLVAVNAGRVLGSAFLLLHAAGRLPATFAHSAGWGDVTTGVLAIPVVLAIRNRVPGWKWYTAAWNLVGLADLVAAVTLGVGSAPGSMLRFIYETPGSGAIVQFPWVMVPAFFVPFYMLTHIAIFAGLAASERVSADRLGSTARAA